MKNPVSHTSVFSLFVFAAVFTACPLPQTAEIPKQESPAPQTPGTDQNEPPSLIPSLPESSEAGLRALSSTSWEGSTQSSNTLEFKTDMTVAQTVKGANGTQTVNGTYAVQDAKLYMIFTTPSQEKLPFELESDGTLYYENLYFKRTGTGSSVEGTWTFADSGTVYELTISQHRFVYKTDNNNKKTSQIIEYQGSLSADNKNFNTKSTRSYLENTYTLSDTGLSITDHEGISTRYTKKM